MLNVLSGDVNLKCSVISATTKEFNCGRLCVKMEALCAVSTEETTSRLVDLQCIVGAPATVA